MALAPASAGGPPPTPPILRLSSELAIDILSRLLLFEDDEIHLCYTGSFYLGAAANVGRNTLAILRTCRVFYRIGSALFFRKNLFNMGEPLSEMPSSDFPPQFCSGPLSPKSLRTIRRMVIVRMPSGEAVYSALYKSSFAIQALAALGANLDSITLAFGHDIHVWDPAFPLNFWKMCFDFNLHSYASEALPALRQLLLQRRLKALRFISYDRKLNQFDEYQLAVTCLSRIPTNVQLAAPWPQMSWRRSVPDSAAVSESATDDAVCYLLTIAGPMPGFAMTMGKCKLILAQNVWHTNINGYESMSKIFVPKHLGGLTAQIPRARLSQELQMFLNRTGVDYWEDAPQPDMIDHDKVRALLDEWRSNPSKVIDLPPPTDELLEAVGNEPEPWQAALLAGADDSLPFSPYVHYLCCAVSNCHLTEIRPQDLDWLVKAQKELVLFREARREDCYRKWIPDYFGPAPTGL